MQSSELKVASSTGTKSIFRPMLMFTLSSQLTQMIGIAAGVVARNLLGPTLIGVWTTLQLVLQYASYGALGTTTGLHYEIPYQRGKGNEEKATSIKNLVLSFQIIASLTIACSVVFFALLTRAIYASEITWGLLFVSVLVILQRIDSVLITIVRSYKDFTLASYQRVLSAIVNLALIAVLASLYNFYGFLTAMVLSFLFNIYYNTYHFKFNYRFELNSKIGRLIAFGLPLMLLSVLEAVLKSIDKIMIVRFLGFKEVGFYSIALMASNFLVQIPNAVGIVIRPHMQEKFGERDRVDDVKDHVNKAARALMHLMPLVIGIGWILLPLFVKHVLPQYISGVVAAQWLILGSFFSAITIPYSTVVVSIRKQFYLFPIVGTSMAFAIALDYLAIVNGYGITGIAIATTFSLFIHVALLFVVAGKFLYGFWEAGKRFLEMAVFFSYTTASLLGISRWVNCELDGVTIAAQLGIFTAFHIPLIWSLNKEYDIVHFIRSKLNKSGKGRVDG